MGLFHLDMRLNENINGHLASLNYITVFKYAKIVQNLLHQHLKN